MTSPPALRAAQEALGARFAPRRLGLYDGAPVRELAVGYGPADGTDGAGGLAAEVAALRSGCALLDRSHQDLLVLTGADRRRFLGAMVTCEVKGLEAGDGAYGFFTGRKGEVLADFALLDVGEEGEGREERFLLELPPGRARAMADHLTPYILADRVVVEVPDDGAGSLVALALAGPKAAEVLTGLLGEAPPEAPWSHRSGEVAGIAVRVARRPLLGMPAWTLWVESGAAGELFAALAEVATPVGQDAAEVVRVAGGRPGWGMDFDDGNLPQETGLEEEAVSYTKGCYLGQEVVARIHYRGGVRRGIVGLRFEEAGAARGGDGPAPGTELILEERGVGRVTSVVRLPGDGEAVGQAVGLGVVHSRGAEPGTRLSLATGGEATVVERPAAAD